MNAAASIAERIDQAEPIMPPVLPVADLATWAKVAASPTPFYMAGRIPAREITLLTGIGGSNKSTFGQQLATCSAAGIPMLGIDVMEGATLYVTAEDHDERLHWMHEHICRSLGVDGGALAGKLFLSSIRGTGDNTLASFDADGRIKSTDRFATLRNTIAAMRVRLVVLDNIGHVFGGNENDRVQVTSFINLLYSLCRDFGVTLLLIGHPNKAGDSYSGSTAWLNAVRSQLVLEHPDDSLDPDARMLSVGKANYARKDEALAFRWHEFALIRDEDLPDDRRADLGRTIAAAAENAAFLACLRARNDQGEGRQVGPAPGSNYAPSQFEGMPEAKGFRRDKLKVAMERLFTLGAIETFTFHNKAKSRDVTVIREASPERSPTFPNAFPNASRTVPERDPEPLPNGTRTPPPHPPLYYV